MAVVQGCAVSASACRTSPSLTTAPRSIFGVVAAISAVMALRGAGREDLDGDAQPTGRPARRPSELGYTDVVFNRGCAVEAVDL